MKIIYIPLCLVLFSIVSFAQKVPDVQVSNMVAPANLRIDGKTTDWNDTFAAENKRTELFYSLANDDKNLYLVVKSSSSANTNKIMAGGITFTVNTQGKKKEKDAQSITYPLIKRAERGQAGRQGQNRQTGAQGGFQNRVQQSQQQRDSVMLVQRKTKLATVKEIKISGFKSISDSLVSIYNEYGIKAVGSFDIKGNYVCEFAIPLGLFELSSNSDKEFVYQIKVNGLNMAGFGGGDGAPRGGFGGGNAGGGNFGGGARGGNGGGNFGGGGSTTDMMSPTDFWGKYNLVKK